MFVVLVTAVPASAITVDELDVTAGLLLISTTFTAPVATAASPIVPIFGAGLPMGIAGPFYVEPMIEFFGTYYLWTGTDVAPAASETGEGGFYTIGSLISLHAGLRYEITPVIRLGGSLGLDLLLRFPFEFQNTTSVDQADQSSALSYFFSDGRFFYPESRLFFRWQISDPVALSFNLRAFYPLFHLWDGLSQSFLEQFMFSGELGFGVRLGAK
jgi:hypothetical protein